MSADPRPIAFTLSGHSRYAGRDRVDRRRSILSCGICSPGEHREPGDCGAGRRLSRTCHGCHDRSPHDSGRDCCDADTRLHRSRHPGADGGRLRRSSKPSALCARSTSRSRPAATDGRNESEPAARFVLANQTRGQQWSEHRPEGASFLADEGEEVRSGHRRRFTSPRPLFPDEHEVCRSRVKDSCQAVLRRPLRFEATSWSTCGRAPAADTTSAPQ